jgi:hypothetical protein
VGAAAAARDVEFFKDIACKQVNAGADMLDVNGGLPGQELEVLPWLVNIVQETVSVPLCLDSADPEALRRALPLCKQRAMINSITDEPARIAALLPVLKEFRPKVIALCLGEAGPPNTAEERVAHASHLVDLLTKEGFVLDDIYVDGCVLPVAAGCRGTNHCALPRRALERRRQQRIVWASPAQTAQRNFRCPAHGARPGRRHRGPLRCPVDGQHPRRRSLAGTRRVLRQLPARLPRRKIGSAKGSLRLPMAD